MTERYRFHIWMLWAVLAALIALPSLGVAAVPGCLDLLDQSQISPGGVPTFGATLSSEFEWAQSITIGVPGMISRVRFDATRASLPPTDPLIVELRRLDGGRPSRLAGDVLASVIVPADSLPTSDLCDWMEVDFLSSAVVVSPGDQICIVWRTSSANLGSLCGYTSGSDPTDRYTGGTAWYRPTPIGEWQHMSNWGNPDDFDFMLYICDLPVPTRHASWGQVKSIYR